MGQKINPVGLRVGIIRDWEGRWFAEKDYATLLHEDLKIRRFVKSKLYNSGVARIEIERAANRVKVTIHTARPGMVIGRGGTEVENLRKSLEKLTDKQVSLNIAEVKTPDLNAQLVAENICFQLERRSSYRRAMKQAITRIMRLGALGVKVRCSGRLMGAEIARTEGYSEGKVPLHTLRADIDYAIATAHTTYGQIGVKVWIYKGEVLPQPKAKAAEGGE
ncbi:MAG TPA: 30S ribosomal protein S3 [Firmicutes bacterium]|nr:30S ribosomal protein S3 [Bacillota bacterium]